MVEDPKQADLTTEDGDTPLALTLRVKPIKFPNFITIDDERLTSKGKIAVARLSDDQAAIFWDSMKSAWLEHVAARRDALAQ